jgi:hypothetical protein
MGGMGENAKTAEQDKSIVNSVPANQLPSLENTTQSDRIGRKAKEEDRRATISASKGDLEGGEINNTEGKHLEVNKYLIPLQGPQERRKVVQQTMESPAARITAGRPSVAMLTF